DHVASNIPCSPADEEFIAIEKHLIVIGSTLDQLSLHSQGSAGGPALMAHQPGLWNECTWIPRPTYLDICSHAQETPGTCSRHYSPLPWKAHSLHHNMPSLTFPDQDMVIDDDSYFSHAEPVDNIANDRSISEVNPAMDTIDVDEIDDDFSDLEPEKRLIEDDLGDLDDLPLEEIFSDDFGDHAPKKQLIKDDFADIATLPVDGFEDLTLGQSPASGYPPAVKETIQEEAALYDFDVDANRTNNGKNESTHDGFYADNAGETDNANIEDPSEQPITSDEQSALGHSGIPLKRSTNLIRPACRHLSCI
ncbi:hypothetical protein BGZ80_005552, partial [Entomortierella chlamydospora]